MQIRAKTISDAHVKVCKAIEGCDDRYEYLSEDNEIVWEYPEPVLIIVGNPISNDMMSPICGFGKMAFEQYKDDFLYGNDNDFSYTYHDRLWDYRGGVFIHDQIDDIVVKLKQSPTSRRAMAITWHPGSDIESDNPPCLQRIQFLIRNGKLNMDVNFRSNDCLSAINQNMYAFVHLQEQIAKELNVEVGIYSHYITSAHFYPVRDAEERNKLRRLIYK